jgi:hypothetical protein
MRGGNTQFSSAKNGHMNLKSRLPARKNALSPNAVLSDARWSGHYSLVDRANQKRIVIAFYVDGPNPAQKLLRDTKSLI